MGDTSIEWTATVNPDGSITPGCYAERVFPRTAAGQCSCGHRPSERSDVERVSEMSSLFCHDRPKREADNRDQSEVIAALEARIEALLSEKRRLEEYIREQREVADADGGT